MFILINGLFICLLISSIYLFNVQYSIFLINKYIDYLDKFINENINLFYLYLHLFNEMNKKEYIYYNFFFKYQNNLYYN